MLDKLMTQIKSAQKAHRVLDEQFAEVGKILRELGLTCFDDSGSFRINLTSDKGYGYLDVSYNPGTQRDEVRLQLPQGVTFEEAVVEALAEQLKKTRASISLRNKQVRSLRRALRK